MTRLHILAENLLKDGEAALITSEPNRYYYLDLPTGDAGVLLLTKKESFFLIDSRYTEVAEKMVRTATVVEQKDTFAQLKELLEQAHCRRLYIEDEVSLGYYRTLQAGLSDFELVADGALTHAVMQQRMRKDKIEKRRMRAAQEITDAAFTYMLTRIEEGRTERDLALELDTFMKKAGSDGLAFETILIGGTNTSLPHGVPGSYKLRKGDFVTMDFGAKWQGYCTDMTRTVAIGKVSEEQRSVYHTVFQAQKAGLAAVRAGRKGCEVDAVSRNLIYEAGYEGCFGHGLGHSVGIEIHENPRFSPLCNMVVPEDAVMTVEPGIYLPGKFGVRIEDTVFVTAEGCEILAQSPKNLIEL